LVIGRCGGKRRTVPVVDVPYRAWASRVAVGGVKGVGRLGLVLPPSGVGRQLCVGSVAAVVGEWRRWGQIRGRRRFAVALPGQVIEHKPPIVARSLRQSGRIPLLECRPTMNDPSVATPRAPADEAALVERGQRGDLDAFNALVELHQRLVYNLCLRMLGHAARAEDATTE